MTGPGSHIDALLLRLRSTYGPEKRFGRSSRLFQFGSRFTCSVNYSKELRGLKFFYGLSAEVLDGASFIPSTDVGHFVLLVCGHEDAVLWLPRKEVLAAMAGVSSRKLDVFRDGADFVLQTTGHPKVDVTRYLNAAPPAALITGSDVQERQPAVRCHSEMQLGLAKIGCAEGCSVWVPPSDRNLQFGRENLRDLTCSRLPNFGFDENTRRVVANIDVLWLTGNVIHRAFEIEATTSIYSGLLRLNDLALAQPNNRIILCIVAEAARRPQVIGQMRRPTFRSLSEVCTFASFDRVRAQAAEVEHLHKRGITRVSGILPLETLKIETGLLDMSDLQG